MEALQKEGSGGDNLAVGWAKPGESTAAPSEVIPGSVLSPFSGAAALTLTTLSPSSAAAGGPAFTLTVNGSNFVNGSVVSWNGANRTTTFVSATQLTAAIPAVDIAAAGSASVTVQNPGGAVSNALTFTISSASTPTLTTLSPSSAAAGGPAFTLTVNGSNFVNGSVVSWNGANRTTTFVSATQLTAAIPAADIAATGSASVTVQNPGGAISNPLTFTISAISGSPGAITREVWTGIGGLTTVANIPVGAAPNLTDTRPTFEAPTDWADNYGTRMRGYITAPVTGSYTFWIASDDNSELWLSVDSNPANKVRMASVSDWTGARQWDKFSSQKSPAITLTAGQRYYAEALQKEGAGGDNLAVGWAKPGESTAAPSEVIPGSVLSPFSGAAALTLTTLSPSSAAAGGPAFTLTVNGSNFVNGSVVSWNGANRTTTFVSATQLTAAIPAADIAAAGSASVTVQNPGGAVSNALTFTISGASTPTLTTLSPNSAAAGGPAFTLTVNGSNFVNGSVVSWNGANRTTTFVSATQLTAAIPAADIAAAGSASVTVQNPGGAVSNPLTFTISGASMPTLTTLSPSSAAAGGPAFTLTVNGSNFVNGSVVSWNGANRTTTFVSATQLTAAIPAADIAATGSASVTVQNPGGAISNPLTFTISAISGSPGAITREVWTGIGGLTTVANIPVGAAPNLTDTRPTFEAPTDWADNYGTRMRGYITAPVTGSYTFWIASDDNSELWLSVDSNPANKVRMASVSDWTGARQWDKFSSQKSPAITLTAGQRYYVEALQKEGAGGDNLAVGWAKPGESTAAPSEVIPGSVLSPFSGAAALTLTTLSPSSAAAGGPAFTLTVNGSNFVNGSVVSWNGANRTTTFVSATQLTAAIPAADIAAAGSASVTVQNPGGAVSNALTFTISGASTPTLTTLSPNSAAAGGPAFTLTVNGSNFVNGSVVSWNGANRTTTFVSATQLTAAIPAADIAAAGSASVTVQNPGGAVSNALTFTISSASTPTLTTLSPSSAAAGGPAFTLTVNGSNFVNGSVVSWNGANRTTTFVSATQLTAAIPAADIAATGSASVTVQNPGGAISNPLTFTISAISGSPGAITREVWTGIGGLTTVANIPVGAAPNLTDTRPTFEAPTDWADNYGTRMRGYITAPVTGSYTFWIASDDNSELWLSVDSNPANKVRMASVSDWTGARQWDKFSSQKSPAITLTAGQRYYVEALQKEGAGGDNLAVGWAKPGESTAAPSEVIPGSVLSPFSGAAALTLTTLSPSSAAAGGPAFTLTVNGSNFVNGSVVSWNGANRTTTFVSATQLTAAIPAADIAATGSASVTVQNPGGAASNALTFTISSASTPTLTTLSPNSAAAGGPAFTLTVNGSNFVNGSVVSWNGANRTTTFVSATQLTAAIPAVDIAATGSASVTVQNPGGAVSNPLTFTISAISGSPGAITREVWTGIGGLTTVANIPVGAAPNLTDTRPTFEAPTDWADNYGTRMRGYITAPVTGSYTFWIASDDNSELWLSVDSNPANKVRMASVSEWTGARQWDKFSSQKSPAITLTAGQRYYVEALQKEGAGGDNLAVGWAKPGESTAAPSEVIPGSVLSPFSGPATP